MDYGKKVHDLLFKALSQRPAGNSLARRIMNVDDMYKVLITDADGSSLAADIATIDSIVDIINTDTKYLYTNADAALANVTDDSFLAQICAVDGDISDFNDNTMSLEALNVDTDALISYLTAGGDIHDVLYDDAVGASLAVDIASIKTITDLLPTALVILSGVSFRGIVTAVNPGVSFTISTLAGIGTGAFVDANSPWYAYVFRDAGGVAAAPQGEQKKVTGYTSATGLFTTDAFTANVEVGDDIVIMSNKIASIENIIADTNEMQTDWVNGGRLDLLIDELTTQGDTNETKLDSVIAVTESNEITGTLSYLDAGGEQTILEQTISTRRRIDSIWLDAVNMTQNGTIIFYHKIDASNYREFDRHEFTVATDSDGILIDGFTVNNDWKMSWTEGADEGAARNLPYNVIWQELE